MRFFRSERVQKLVREELSKILGREMDFENALVTITQVEVDKKLEHAKIFVSVIPEAAEETALAALDREAGRLQHILTRTINIKPMPRIMFAIDHGPQHAADVEKLLDEQEDRD